MKDEHEPQRTLTKSSELSSLRNLIAEGNKNVTFDEKDGYEDDDDSFIFTDHTHQQHDFEMFSETLREFGLIDGGAPGQINSYKAEKAESTPLLNEKKIGVKGDQVELKAEATKEEPRKGLPYRRESKIIAYKKGQKELFLEVLDQIEKIQSATRKDKGFKESKFAFGLVNCLLITYVFGSHPEHFWILYAVETIFWMSYKFRGMLRAKPLSEALYYLDFCWVMNALGVTVLLTFTVLDKHLSTDIMPLEVRKKLFLACFGVFCGPVFTAAMVLPFVAFLFHDVNTMANLIIHLMPSMVMYTYRWHAVEISNAYPTTFPNLVGIMDEVNNSNNSESLAPIALAVYFGWFVPYTTWMLLIGLKLPVISKDKGKAPPKYDTVFHSTVKGGLCELIGTAVWKRPKEISRDCSERNDYELRDFLLYMTAHALGSCGVGIILTADILCFRCGKIAHATLLWFTTIICAKRGADRYTYYVTTMYGQKLRKAFRELEVHQEQKE